MDLSPKTHPGTIAPMFSFKHCAYTVALFLHKVRAQGIAAAQRVQPGVVELLLSSGCWY